ncbi:hypothetical protein KAT51_06255 [bacterium]|nr:hypothetical protein [bacterium]
MTEILLKEFYGWKTLLARPEWRNYVNLLTEYAEFLQKEVNRSIREGNHNEATKFLAQKDLIPKILGKVKDRIKTCKE